MNGRTEHRPAAATTGPAKFAPSDVSVNVRHVFQQALQHHQAGHLGEAERLYRQILQTYPRHAGTLHLQGVLALQRGDPAVAVDLIAKAIAQNDQVPAFHNNLANALQAQGRLVEAVASYSRALAQQPDYAEAHYNLGAALQAQGRLTEAVASYGRALIYKSDYVEAHSNLGIAFQAQGKLVEAVASYGRALFHKPDYAAAHYNLGNALAMQGKPDEAIDSYGNALAHQPNLADAHYNLGGVLRDKGKLVEAAASFQQAMICKPDYAEAHYSLGRLHLLTGRFGEGWPEYEWRLSVSSWTQQRPDFGIARWQGEPLDGRTILLHAEQGLGDTIQFCRYVPMVAARGGRVVLEVHRSLVRLFKELAGGAQIIAKGDPLPPFDRHCPLMSLPRVFDTRLETIPASVPYLTTEAPLVAAWRDRLPQTGRRIGLVWQGNPANTNDHKRSIPPACLAPLARLFDGAAVHFVSLQKNGPAFPEDFPVIDVMNEIDDFADTAALIANLDLVISVDTAVAHLAGALGRPVYMLLAADSHWVWMLERTDTPWYPKTRLFRQRTAGAWEDVVAEMAGTLRVREWGR